ncbi:unnamed protein product [Adineta ricciae]|uniref:Uncharacterized protein n=1 Tax=Adineta ricciae TaxID=249248 RepID=A0A815FTL4_ADIRI|nr:unnamed protein product [Adineta ricciae]
MNSSDSSLHLTSHEWLLINRIIEAYDAQIIQCDKDRFTHYSLSHTKLIDFLNDEHDMYRTLIQFYKQIEEFRQINIEDRILLIKCNLTHLIHIHHVLRDNFIENSKIGLHMSQWISPSFHAQMSQARHRYDYFIKYPSVLKLALSSLIFTINLSRLSPKQSTLTLTDYKLIVQHQYYYVTLLWKYLNVTCGEKYAIKAVEILVFQYLRYQLLMEHMEDVIIHDRNPTEYCPLTKSVLCLT